jgi:hypothetical protein
VSRRLPQAATALQDGSVTSHGEVSSTSRFFWFSSIGLFGLKKIVNKILQDPNIVYEVYSTLLTYDYLPFILALARSGLKFRKFH